MLKAEIRPTGRREPVPLRKPQCDHIHAVLTLALGLWRHGNLRMAFDSHVVTYCSRSGAVYIDDRKFPSLDALKAHARS